MSQGAPPMWGTNVTYAPGDIVWYNGSCWRCETHHTSGPINPEPPRSFNVWTPVDSVNVGQPQGGQQFHQRRAAAESYGPEQDRQNAGAEDQGRASDINAMIGELEGANTWRVGGVGVMAFSPNPQLEDARRRAFVEWTSRHQGDMNNWMNAARQHTAVYESWRNNNQLRPLVRWQIVEEGQPFPADALPIGRERAGEVLYASRCWQDGSLQIGKSAQHLGGRNSFAYGGREVCASAFEVLCGDASAIRWVHFQPGQRANQNGWMPVDAGREAGDGRAILVARAEHQGSIQPAKVQWDESHCNIGYGGKEDLVQPFEVLVFDQGGRT